MRDVAQWSCNLNLKFISVKGSFLLIRTMLSLYLVSFSCDINIYAAISAFLGRYGGFFRVYFVIQPSVSRIFSRLLTTDDTSMKCKARRMASLKPVLLTIGVFLRTDIYGVFLSKYEGADVWWGWRHQRHWPLGVCVWSSAWKIVLLRLLEKYETNQVLELLLFVRGNEIKWSMKTGTGWYTFQYESNIVLDLMTFVAPG